jgi:hypothetical protein
MFMVTFHTKFHMLSSPSNRKAKENFSSAAMLLFYILQPKHYLTKGWICYPRSVSPFQDSKLYSTGFAPAAHVRPTAMLLLRIAMLVLSRIYTPAFCCNVTGLRLACYRVQVCTTRRTFGWTGCTFVIHQMFLTCRLYRQLAQLLYSYVTFCQRIKKRRERRWQTQLCRSGTVYSGTSFLSGLEVPRN